MKFRCKHCGKYLGEIKRLNVMSFTRTKKIEIKGEQLLITCRCGEIKIINLEKYRKIDAYKNL